MNELIKYDKNNKKSIIEFAKKLIGRTLKESCENNIANHKYIGKGNFGQVLEKYYFLYQPNSDSAPDFPIARLELKTTPLKKLKNNDLRSKERLVLNIINYEEIINQTFETSSFLKKNANILLIVYLYESEKDILDYSIKLVDEWSFPKIDLEIIKKDWEKIRRKVEEGKAHELSEGDTLYLGACTKGAKGGNFRKQPNSNILAKQRAFSLKQGYVNHIMGSFDSDSKNIYGKLIPTLENVKKETQEELIFSNMPSIVSDFKGTYGKLIPTLEIAKKKTLEELVISKYELYYNLSIEEILNHFGLKLNKKEKAFYSNLTKAILGIELGKEIEEFDKADIKVKSVRLIDKDLPKEDISFPAFKYIDLCNEDWEESSFIELLEHKFFFVFYKFENEQLKLKKVKFWNMPYVDIENAKKVWIKTKEVVSNGNIVYKIVGKRRFTNFPNKGFNPISHVRPHAKNSKDTFPLPIQDKKTKVFEYTKHSFWLNNSYVRDEIYLK